MFMGKQELHDHQGSYLCWVMCKFFEENPPATNSEMQTQLQQVGFSVVMNYSVVCTLTW